MSVCSVSARTVQARPSARQGMLMWWCLVAFCCVVASLAGGEKARAGEKPPAPHESWRPSLAMMAGPTPSCVVSVARDLTWIIPRVRIYKIDKIRWLGLGLRLGLGLGSMEHMVYITLDFQFKKGRRGVGVRPTTSYQMRCQSLEVRCE